MTPENALLLSAPAEPGWQPNGFAVQKNATVRLNR
jgi:hypothetical protein